MVTVSLWGNSAGDPRCSQDMVGMGLPLEVQEISVASPSSTVFVVFSREVVIGGSAKLKFMRCYVIHHVYEKHCCVVHPSW